MICMSCAREFPDGSAFCPGCGADQRPGPDLRDARQSAAQPASTASSPRSYNFNTRTWDRGDFAVALGAPVLVVLLFLPWFTLTYSYGGVGSVTEASISALDAKGWMYVVVIVALALLGYVVATATGALPRLTAHWQVVAGASAFMLLLTLVCFLDVPTGLGRSAFAFLGLATAMVMVIGAARARWDTARGTSSPAPVPRAHWSSSSGEPVTAGLGVSASPSSPSLAGVPTHGPAATYAAEPAGSATLTCMACGHGNPGDSRFCESCGAAFETSTRSGATD